MKYYQEFARSGATFDERYGQESELTAALGRVALSFAELDQEVDLAIRVLLNLDEDKAHVLTSEMSFRNKVNALASLARLMVGRLEFGVGIDGIIDRVAELSTCCFRAEELRNQLMHSSFEREGDRVVRRKVSAKAPRGLRRRSEDIDSAYFGDVADYLGYMAFSVEELFQPDGPMRKPNGV